MNIGSVRARYREEAMQRKINPRDVDLLLADLLAKPIPYLISHEDEPLDEQILERFRSFAERRFRGEPLQYIRGRTEFYGREFAVDARVLIPRPETEILVEIALSLAARNGRVLDVGTGSGCIATTLAMERPDLSVLATDRSMDALLVARANARRLQATVRLAQGDVLGAIRGRFSLIASNPPYIAADEMPELQREVRDHEPLMALSPGTDPLEIVRELLRQSRERLEPQGALAIEIGFGQGDAVSGLAHGLGWTSVELFDDLAGIPRVLVVRQ
ncbi:MAG TPA: peptide chain release factor N(5)-glutamine methyltransferase [Thermoanaerobaculia bacterium]